MSLRYTRTQSGLSSIHSCTRVATFHHLVFPLNLAIIHSKRKTKATKIAALKQVLLTVKEVETTKCNYTVTGRKRSRVHLISAMHKAVNSLFNYTLYERLHVNA